MARLGQHVRCAVRNEFSFPGIVGHTRFEMLKLGTNTLAGAECLPEALHGACKNEECVTIDGRSFPVTSSSVSLHEAVRLYQIARQLRPIHSAEIGFCQGVSAMAILQGLKDNGVGTHHIIDPFQSLWWKNAGLDNVRKAGLEQQMRFYEQFVEDAASQLPPLLFAFIDGSHLFDLTILDFVLMDKKLEVGGVLAFHDLWMPSLQKVLRFILSNRAYKPYLEGAPSNDPSRGEFKRKCKKKLAPLFRSVSQLPGLDRVFSPELLVPYWTLGLEGNMAFVQKTACDRRDYKFYRQF